MPTYQYVCTACGEQLEAVQRFADEPLTECPSCEGRLRKLFNSVGIVFKGSGFYRTDSRKGAESSGDATPAKSGASTGGSEAKGGSDAKGSSSGDSGKSGGEKATGGSGATTTSTGTSGSSTAGKSTTAA